MSDSRCELFAEGSIEQSRRVLAVQYQQLVRDGVFQQFGGVREILRLESSVVRAEVFDTQPLGRFFDFCHEALALVHKGQCRLEAARTSTAARSCRRRRPPTSPGRAMRGGPRSGSLRGERAGDVPQARAACEALSGWGDDRLAAAWHAAGVPLETVRRALLLGCVRKSMTLMDHPSQPLIAHLAYIGGVLEEVREQSFTAGYGQHLEFNLDRCEQYWQAESDKAPGSARPISGQTGRPAGGRRPPSHLRGDREERRDNDGLSHQSTGP